MQLVLPTWTVVGTILIVLLRKRSSRFSLLLLALQQLESAWWWGCKKALLFKFFWCSVTIQYSFYAGRIVYEVFQVSDCPWPNSACLLSNYVCPWGKEGSIWHESSNRQMGSHKCLEWSSHCRVNVLQSVFFVRHALPYLIASKGTIVPVSSLAGILCSNPIPIPPWEWDQQKMYFSYFFLFKELSLCLKLPHIPQARMHYTVRTIFAG